jgi:hypothetical protein
MMLAYAQYDAENSGFFAIQQGCLLLVLALLLWPKWPDFD